MVSIGSAGKGSRWLGLGGSSACEKGTEWRNNQQKSFSKGTSLRVRDHQPHLLLLLLMTILYWGCDRVKDDLEYHV